MALHEERGHEFGSLVLDHELFISPVTLAEVRTFLGMDVLTEARRRTVEAALGAYRVLSIRVENVVDRWVELRTATIRAGTPDDRERRQNDTWIAACALSVNPALPVVTGNLKDFRVLAAANSSLTLIHPDLPL
jgi:predicted nucleic acid-binding protein